MGTRARPATRSISKTPLTPPSRWLVSASCQLDRNRLGYRLVHRVGNEAAWWKDAGIDPAKLPGSSGTTAGWIRGGSRLDRRRNVPRQIEQLTLKVRPRTAQRRPDDGR